MVSGKHVRNVQMCCLKNKKHSPSNTTMTYKDAFGVGLDYDMEYITNMIICLFVRNKASNLINKHVNIIT